MIDRARGIAAFLLVALALASCVGGRAPMAPATAGPGADRAEGAPASAVESIAPAEGETSLRRALEDALAGNRASR